MYSIYSCFNCANIYIYKQQNQVIMTLNNAPIYCFSILKSQISFMFSKSPKPLLMAKFANDGDKSKFYCSCLVKFIVIPVRCYQWTAKHQNDKLNTIMKPL